MEEKNIDLLQKDIAKLIELSNPEQTEEQSKIMLKSGERRYVTALFLDMKGFTVLSERYDHEFIDNLINKLFMIFKNHIDKRGGWIEKFEGDSIFAAFGAKVTHEDDAVRAVDAGLAIQESLKNLQPHFSKLGTEIKVRIGIHSGEVTRSKRA